MLPLQLRYLVVFLMLAMVLNECHISASKLKSKSKSSLTVGNLAENSAGNSESLAINIIGNSKNHLLAVSSLSTLSLATKTKQDNNLIGVHKNLDAPSPPHFEPRPKQRHFDKDQMLPKKRILRTVYQPQSIENLAGINLEAKDIITNNNNKHRRKQGDKLTKRFILLRDVNVKQKVDDDEEVEEGKKEEEKQKHGDVAALIKAKNSNEKTLNNRNGGSGLGNIHSKQHIFLKPTIQTIDLKSTYSPPSHHTSALPPVPTSTSTAMTTARSYTTTTATAVSGTTMKPSFHNIRNEYKKKLTENLRLISSVNPFDNGQLTKSYRHFQNVAGEIDDDEEHHPLRSMLTLHPPVIKESIDLDMNSVHMVVDERSDNKHEKEDDNKKKKKKNDVIKAIIGEVVGSGGYGGGERGIGGVEHDHDDEDDDNANEKDNDDADDADGDVEDEGIMDDDINGFDASDDSEDDDDDDEEDEDDDNGESENNDAAEDAGSDEGDDTIPSNTNSNDVPVEDSDNTDDDVNNKNNNNSEDGAAANDNEAGANDDDDNGNNNDNDNHDRDRDDGDDNDSNVGDIDADINVGDDVFDNDYSDTDDVFSDFSVYQNDEQDEEEEAEEEYGDIPTTSSTSLLANAKHQKDANNLVNSNHAYSNFTETYIKDKTNKLSLDNYLRKTMPLSPIVGVVEPSPPPSVEVLKSELHIPITKIDKSLLVDFHVKPNYSISLKSAPDLNFHSNNLIQDNDSTAVMSATSSTKDHLDDINAVQPQISASTSVGGISLNQQQVQNTIYEKEEIIFNDAEDVTSLSKDLTMDDAFVENNHANGFPLTDIETDAETESLSLDVVTDADSNENNRFLEGVVDAANADEIYDWDEISRNNRRNLMRGRDVVTKFLQIVETQHSLGSNCEAGTSLNLGEGVVDRYAQDRFRIEAEVAVNRANMLTRIFKMTSSAAQADINLLHASVLSMVEFDDDIFAAGNCFDWNEHPSQAGLFCPFAYRLPPPNLGAVLAKDLSMEYHYLGNTSEWFFQARKNAEKVIARNEQYLKAFHLYSNKTEDRIEDDTLAVKYEDGRWSKPYYDCGGGNIWMLTYTVPFFGYENATYHFKGTSGIDIDLRRVDIDQCPQRNIPGSTKPLNIFAGTDKCKQRTTMCEAIQGLGFRRGSYKCVCRKGYYFPDTTSQHKYFNGSLLEEEYEKLMLGKNSTYNTIKEYECLPCAEGCDSCEDSSPCIAALNWPMRTSILVLACIVIGLLPPAAWFTFRYQQVKVVRAASPALLRVIALGAFFIYCTNIVMYPNPNLYTCTARIWLREIGFSLTYGALMLKTWRISVIFRVRSAKAVKITDAALLKRLGCICGAIGTCLLVRTLVSPPDVVVGRTADDLKAFLCKTDWWDYTFTSMEVVFLAWGVRLCIMVRKAPSEFNESRFISMAIYNEFLLTCFLNVSMLFLQSPANPDLLYIIFFCHTQLTITLLLALIFGSKVYIVLRSGKSHQESIGMGAKSSGAKFNFRPQVRTFANPSSVTTSTVPVAATTSAENKLSDQEAMEEIRQLSVQLQRIQEMAPPKGVAVMTISSLLDGLKTPGSMMMVAAAAASHSAAGNQLTVRPQKPEALPLLSLNTEMQKYNQLQQKAIASSAMTTVVSTNNNVMTTTTNATSIPSTKITTATPLSVVTSPTFQNKASTKVPVAAHEDKSINTELSGNCITEDMLQQRQHIICDRCYDKCRELQTNTTTTAYHHCSPTMVAPAPVALTKCQLMGSPPPEGSLSFKHIKLECMCSQSDDLDQLPVRRVTKRTAATNTPSPSGGRTRKHSKRHHNRGRDAKVRSSNSLPGDETTMGSLALTGRCHQTIGYKNKCLSEQQQQQQQLQQEQQQQQQICDNCKNKFRKLSQKSALKQHKNLSRLSTKCSKLLSDIDNARSTTTAAGGSSVAQHHQQFHRRNDGAGSCGQSSSMRKQFSTDDIIFYTTTDTSNTESDSDDDGNHADDCDSSGDTMGAAVGDNKRGATYADDSSSLSQSKSESKVPFEAGGIEDVSTLDLRITSQSLGNIITTQTAQTSGGAATAGGSESANKALLDTKASRSSAPSTQSSIISTGSTPATSGPTTSAQQQQQPHAANGNGKSKRPDKLVLNLNDRSKFTKEVSV